MRFLPEDGIRVLIVPLSAMLRIHIMQLVLLLGSG
jgi:hypothetical protein